MLLIVGIFRGVTQQEYEGQTFYSLNIEEKEGTTWKDMKTNIVKVKLDKGYDVDSLEPLVDKAVTLKVRAFQGKKGVGYNLLEFLKEDQVKKLKIA